jgi:histidine triad (HIT) family protein
MVEDTCLFCRIVSSELPATVVYEDEKAIAFLDHRPLFPGHTLLVPREHFETLGDLLPSLVEPCFKAAQLLALAVESALEAQGTFVAMNNRVSQSVPHLHVHIVPRKKKDGLKGFFWPRTKYKDDEEMKDVQTKIVAEIKKVREKNNSQK